MAEACIGWNLIITVMSKLFALVQRLTYIAKKYTLTARLKNTAPMNVNTTLVL